MARALEVSPYVISAETGVPARTIYKWLDDAGGIAQIRTYAHEQAGAAIADSKTALCREVVKRAPKIKDDELMTSYRAVIADNGSEAGAPEATAQANAQVLMVTVQGEDGPETIEVPRE